MPVVILLIIAALLIVAGAGALLIGTDSVVPDRPLAAAIGGSVALVGGFIVMALSLLLREVSRVRQLLLVGGEPALVPVESPSQHPPMLPADKVAPVPPVPASVDTAPAMTIGGAAAATGALAAVAAAVATSAVGEPAEKQETHPPAAAPDFFEEALKRVTQEIAPVAETAARPAAAVAEPVSVDTDTADHVTPETEPKIDIPAKIEKDAKSPDAGKDPFDFEAEFDRMLDEASGAAEHVTAPSSLPAVSDIHLEADASLTDEDRQELESLVRSAVADIEEKDSPTIEEAAETVSEPVVPDIQTLRDRIAAPPPDEAAASEEGEQPAPFVAEIPQQQETAAELPEPSHDARPAHSDSPPPPHIAEADVASAPPPFPLDVPASKTIVRTFSSGLNQYTMYSDGSISADTPSGRFEFASFNELREFIDNYKG